MGDARITMTADRKFYVSAKRRRPVWLPATHRHANRITADGGEVTNTRAIDQMKRKLALADLEPDLLMAPGMVMTRDSEDRIGKVYDLSGGDNHAEQTTTAEKPDWLHIDGWRKLDVAKFSEQSLSSAYSPGAITGITVAVSCNTLSVEASSCRYAGFTGDSLQLQIDTFGRLAFRLRDGDGNLLSTNIDATATGDLANKQRLITGTAGVGGKVRLYSDDAEVSEGPDVPSLQDLSGTFFMGLTPNTRPFWLAWVFVYLKALSAAEVASLHSFSKGD